jgi:hypothetical protein
MNVVQLSGRSVWEEERMYACSGTEIGVRCDGWVYAAPKPAPSPAARVGTLKIVRRSSAPCRKVSRQHLVLIERHPTIQGRSSA